MATNKSTQLASLNILEMIESGVVTPIGWGCGEIFRLRRYIHDFEVAFTIHSNPDSLEVGNFKDIRHPDTLSSLDHSKYILIIYSINFIRTIYQECSKYENLMILPFNSSALGVEDRIRELKYAHSILPTFGTSYHGISDLHSELGY